MQIKGYIKPKSVFSVLPSVNSNFDLGDRNGSRSKKYGPLTMYGYRLVSSHLHHRLLHWRKFCRPTVHLRRTTSFAKLEALTAATGLALSISHWLVLQAIAIIQCKVWFVNTNHQFIPCGSQLHTVQITFSTTCQM